MIVRVPFDGCFFPSFYLLRPILKKKKLFFCFREAAAVLALPLSLVSLFRSRIFRCLFFFSFFRFQERALFVI